MPTSVINYHRTRRWDIDIMRPGPFGNPYRLWEDAGGDRERCLRMFRAYFQTRIEEDEAWRTAVCGLRGRILKCYCKPLLCHGDVYVEWLDATTPMREFAKREIREATAWAMEGQQALHVWEPDGWAEARAAAGRPVPACFAKSDLWAHLFDQDRDRLIATARRLGVRVIKVEHQGTRHQHIDLCGGPLRRARREAAEWVLRNTKYEGEPDVPF